MGDITPTPELPTIDTSVLIQRPGGCDVWVIVEGREHKLWKSGYDVKDGVPTKWAQEVVADILAAEKAEATETAAVLAEKEPAKIDALLAWAKANPETCSGELDGIARLKREVQ